MRNSYIAGGLLLIFIVWAGLAGASDPSGFSVLAPIGLIVGTLIAWPFMHLADKKPNSSTNSPNLDLKASSYRYLKILIIGLLGTILFSVLLAFILLKVSD